MIKFAEEMTRDQLREATGKVLGISNFEYLNNEVLSDKSYREFRTRFPGNAVISSNSSGYSGIIESVDGRPLWKSSVRDTDINVSYLRAQLHWLMPEGFDFPD